MKKIFIFATLLFFVCTAEILEEKEEDFPHHHQRPKKHHKPHESHRDRRQNEEAMELLKKEDPEFYEKIMKFKNEHQKTKEEHLEKLKEKNPEKFEELQKRKEEHKRRWEEHRRRFEARKLDEEEPLFMRRHFAHKAKRARPHKDKKNLRLIEDQPTERADEESMPKHIRDRPISHPRPERPRYDDPRPQRPPVPIPISRPRRPEN